MAVSMRSGMQFCATWTKFQLKRTILNPFRENFVFRQIDFGSASSSTTVTFTTTVTKLKNKWEGPVTVPFFLISRGVPFKDQGPLNGTLSEFLKK